MSKNNDFGGSGRNDREHGVSRRQVLRRAGAGLTATAGAVAISTPVAAEQGAIYDVFEDDEGSDSWSRAWSAAKASLGRMFADDGVRTVEEAATETTEVFNSNSTTLVAYANDELDSSRSKTNLDVIRLRFVKGDTGSTRWILADVDDANRFVSAQMTDITPSRDVDQTVRLEDLAAVEAPDVLENFVENYAEEGKSVDSRLEGRLAGRYGPDVETSLM